MLCLRSSTDPPTLEIVSSRLDLINESRHIPSPTIMSRPTLEMPEWKKSLLEANASITDALASIEMSEMRIALVVNADQHLLGVINDGDIRRGILKGVSLNSNVSEVMNVSPMTMRITDNRNEVLEKMIQNRVYQVPVLDETGRLVGLEVLENYIRPVKKDNIIVLMAGGLGSRLSPLTDDCPKPMLKVGNKPILETILDSFVELGYHRFFFSVNYKAEMITEFFGDGSKWGVSIEYLYEKKRLGTAGALSLLEEPPEHPLIVMNGDLLTKLNFSDLLNFHIENDAAATMCVKDYSYQVPYGVVETEDFLLKEIKEKPVQHFFVNAGIYVLSPDALKSIPEDEFFDMTSLFNKLRAKKARTAVFPLSEYWIDIGKMSDFDRAQKEFASAML